MELGIYTFVENTPINGSSGKLLDRERIENLFEEIKLSDQCGLDVYAIGEHHREEYLSSSPSTLLAAAASITGKIKLSSAVTVLGSEDPVRVFQQFATLDLVSNGRAEIMVGRGSFIESFPLFGKRLDDYDELFTEHLELLIKLNKQTKIEWKGKYRPAIDGRNVYPRPVQKELPIWVAVGGTSQSAYRAGNLGLPMAIGIIGGYASQMKYLTELHKKGAEDAGFKVPPISINSHGFLADDSQKAKKIAFPAFKLTMVKLGKERGWPQMSYEHFEQSTRLEGANAVGSPAEVIEKILYQHELFGHSRYLLQMSVGSMPHKHIMRSIELFATKVAPVIRKEISNLRTPDLT